MFLSRGKGKITNEAKIDMLNMKMGVVQKYKERIKLIPEGLKTLEDPEGKKKPSVVKACIHNQSGMRIR